MKFDRAASPQGGVVLQQSAWSRWERSVWVGVLWLGLVVLYANRTSLPFSITEMAGDLGWDKSTCGLILSSFYVGYMMSQVVGGFLADRYGGAVVQWMCGIAWSLSSLSIVYVAHVSKALVILARFISGLCQGVHYPALASIVAHRVQESEQSAVNGIIFSGSYSGIIVMGLFGSFLLFGPGWHLVFVSACVSGLIWSLLLRYLSQRSSSNLRTHYKLADGHSKGKALRVELQTSVSTSCTKLPWRKILRHPPVIVLFLAHFCHCFFLHNATSWTPTFFHDSFPSARPVAWSYNLLPWVAMVMGSASGGWLAKWILSRGHSATVARKAITSLHLGGSATFLLLLVLLGVREDLFWTTLVLIMLSYFCGGMASVTSCINAVELAPTFAGTLFGVMNTVGAFSGTFSVSVTGYLLHTSGHWSAVFSMMAAVNLLGMIAFLCCGSSKKIPLES